MAKIGRPLKKIDQKQFENLCALQCTVEEIAGFFDVCEETLQTWCRKTYDMTFSAVFAIKRGAGKISLRRKQFQLADKSAAMAIFLGKQFLGQKDSIEVTDNSKRLDELRVVFESVSNATKQDAN